MTAVFIAILNMSITASVVALAVMLVRIPLRKAPKIFSYALWGVVLFRLVFPFSIESVFGLIPTVTANAIPVVLPELPMVEQPVEMPVFAGGAISSISSAGAGSGVNLVHTFFEIAGYVWLAGFVALLIYAAIGYAKLKRRVFFATLVRDNIFESDRITTPFVLGFIRPKIYFPTAVSQHDYILKHEQTHIKRRDYLIKPFAYIVLALHWFNPIIWLSYCLMSRDMEMSCDEAVLREASEDIRGEYSTSLLNLCVNRASLLNPIAFSFGESNVKERVVNVLSFKKSTRWVMVVCVIAVAVFMVGFASNRVVTIVDIPNEYGTYANENPTEIPEVELDWPVPSRYNVSSPFGYRVNPITRRQEFHNGISIPAPTGTNIVAAYDGVVILSGWQGGFGRAVVIDHGNGLTTLYAHNRSNSVSVGDEVIQGQIIAQAGATGMATGPHLYFEVRFNDDAIDPMNFFQ